MRLAGLNLRNSGQKVGGGEHFEVAVRGCPRCNRGADPHYTHLLHSGGAVAGMWKAPLGASCL